MPVLETHEIPGALDATRARVLARGWPEWKVLKVRNAAGKAEPRAYIVNTDGSAREVPVEHIYGAFQHAVRATRRARRAHGLDPHRPPLAPREPRPP